MSSADLTSLEAAYRSTSFEVTAASPPFTLRVGEHSAPLAALHRLHGVATSAYLTAVNPRSVVLPADENARREAQLEQWLRAQGYVSFAGHGVDPRGEWPSEPCVLVLGIDYDAACRLGECYEQNAIVWCPTTAVPDLIMLVPLH